MPALELDPVEARILGVLIEKETTTPDQYPLTLNALSSGCNQRSNRDPVLELSDSDVAAGIERLRRKSLVGAAHASGSRTERYKHAAGTVWQLTPGELAVIAELLLRGAQMPGELRSRADRMSRFETLDLLATTLEGLRQKGFVQRLEPLPGARAPQWDQIVAQRVTTSAGPAAASTSAPARTSLAEGALPLARAAEPRPPAPGAANPLEARVATLEAEVARLRELYETLAGTRASR
jgi:uncharacterized protein YceH (UPF0502 family)